MYSTHMTSSHSTLIRERFKDEPLPAHVSQEADWLPSCAHSDNPFGHRVRVSDTLGLLPHFSLSPVVPDTAAHCLLHLVRGSHSPGHQSHTHTLCHQSGQPTRRKGLPHFTGNAHDPELTPPQITAVHQRKARGTYSDGNAGPCPPAFRKAGGWIIRC